MATQAMTRRDAEDGNPLIVLRTQLEQRASEFKMALPGHISPEKFQRTILTAVQANPTLLQADRRSFITSSMKAAQDGLLPDGREAALVEFQTSQKVDGEWRKLRLVQYMPMVYGLRKKILQSGEVKDIQANVVYRQEVEAGLFIYEEGTERMLRHKPLLDADFEPTDADIVAAYSVATLSDGSMSFEVMRRSEINKVRESSQTGATKDRKGNPREPKGPWVDWFSEMAKKTVMRRHSKTLPMSGDIIDVEALDDMIAARSSVAALSSVDADEAPRITPPTRGDQVEEQAQDTSGAVYDVETGEVHRDERPEPTSTYKEEEIATGDAETAAADQAEARGPHPDRETADGIIAEIKRKELLPDLRRLEDESQEAYDALPPELQAEIDEAFAAKRQQLQEKK